MTSSKTMRTLMDYKIIFILAGLFVILAILSPFFFTAGNFINILSQIAIYGVVGCAMTIAIIGGEFDLSVGSTFGLSTVLFIICAERFGVFPAVLAVMGAGIAIGLLNGCLVSIGINSFIATLATMIAVKGISLTITGGEPVQWYDDGLFEFGNGSVAGIPYLVIVLFIFVAVTQFVLRRTVFGRNIYAIGANYEVALYSNIKARRYKIAIFAILGASAAFAGIMLASRLGAGLGIYGEDLSMYVVAAVVVGGTSLSGGKGSAIQTLLGLLFMGVLFNGLNMLSVSTYWQLFIRGIIVVAVIIIDRMMQMHKER